jgi:hypothetical protein
MNNFLGGTNEWTEVKANFITLAAIMIVNTVTARLQ